VETRCCCTYNRLMEVDELMRRAWEAVKKSGVPEHLQETAFKEAVAALREQEEGSDTGDTETGAGTSTRRRTTTKRAAGKKTSAKRAGEAEPTDVLIPDEGTFFAQLADESGVDEQDLRDIFQLTRQGEVRITSPTRRLGDNVADQARSVVALVGGARAHGLGERPVNAKAVRAELDRKNCYDVTNFSSKHLGPMRGFNTGGRDEIVLTSRWVNDFKSAVDQAHGRSNSDDESA
jgi:hypothetical protein